MNKIIRELVEFSLDLRYEDVPRDVVHEAKRALYDTLGCIFGGHESRDVHIVRNIYRHMEGLPEATVLVSGEKLPALHAALINAVAVHTSTADSYYAFSHPNYPAVMIPAGLAAAELAGASTKELLVALIIGYEFQIRLRELLEPTIGTNQIHSADLAHWSTALLVSRLLRQSCEKTMHALGLARIWRHTNDGGSSDNFVTDQLHQALAVQWGFKAAVMAAAEFPRVEGNVLGVDLHPESAARMLVEDYGDPFRIMVCSMRAFPTDLRLQTAVTLVIRLAKEYTGEREQIDAIEVSLPELPEDILHLPKGPHGADKHLVAKSLPFCIARSFLDGKLDWRSFDDEHLNDIVVRNLMGKVKALKDEGLVRHQSNDAPARVTLRMIGGDTYTLQAENPKGHPIDPLTDWEIEEKVSKLIGSCLSADRQTQMRGTVWDCEQLAGMHQFMSMMVEN
ncbi:MmgE/PrpD family protein [Candidatus Neomarinimicrobiota bacterium]